MTALGAAPTRYRFDLGGEFTRLDLVPTLAYLGIATEYVTLDMHLRGDAPTTLPTRAQARPMVRVRPGPAAQDQRSGPGPGPADAADPTAGSGSGSGGPESGSGLGPGLFEDPDPDPRTL
jgi:hypothetical protein